MNIWTMSTIRLNEAPAGIGTGMYKAWSALFEVYGFDGFHPIEGRGVLRASLGLSIQEAVSRLESLVANGYAATGAPMATIVDPRD